MPGLAPHCRRCGHYLRGGRLLPLRRRIRGRDGDTALDRAAQPGADQPHRQRRIRGPVDRGAGPVLHHCQGLQCPAGGTDQAAGVAGVVRPPGPRLARSTGAGGDHFATGPAAADAGRQQLYYGPHHRGHHLPGRPGGARRHTHRAGAEAAVRALQGPPSEARATVPATGGGTVLLCQPEAQRAEPGAGGGRPVQYGAVVPVGPGQEGAAGRGGLCGGGGGRHHGDGGGRGLRRPAGRAGYAGNRWRRGHQRRCRRLAVCRPDRPDEGQGHSNRRSSHQLWSLQERQLPLCAAGAGADTPAPGQYPHPRRSR